MAPLGIRGILRSPYLYIFDPRIPSDVREKRISIVMRNVRENPLNIREFIIYFLIIRAFPTAINRDYGIVVRFPIKVIQDLFIFYEEEEKYKNLPLYIRVREMFPEIGNANIFKKQKLVLNNDQLRAVSEVCHSGKYIV